MSFNRSFHRLFFAAAALTIASWALVGISHADERLWLDATINGKPAHFIFDTGTGPLVLSSRAAARLGLSYTNAPKDARPDPGKMMLGVSEICDLQIGDKAVRTYFSIIDIPEVVPSDCDRFVGWDGVNNSIFVIDAIQDSVTCPSNLPPEVTDWKKFGLVTNSDILRLQVRDSNGRQAIVLVDTGFQGGVKLGPAQWKAWKAAHPNQPTTFEGYYSPISGVVVAEESWASEFPLGSLVMMDVPVTEADTNDVILGGKDYYATLGMTALKRLDFVVDRAAGVAYVQAWETLPRAYQHNRLGAVFSPLDVQSEDLIGHVAEGSPAWEAGIRNGDILMRIGELDVTKWRTDPAVMPIKRFWTGPPGTKLDLTLKRGQEIFKTNVVLRQILPPDANSSLNAPQ